MTDDGGALQRILTRRRFVTGLGSAAAALAAVEGLWLEPRRLQVSRLRLGGAPSTGETPLRLSVLTDLHLRSIGALERAVVAGILEFRPHAILVVGDAIDRADALPLLDRFLDLLPPATPKYATLGNWEHWCGVAPEALATTYRRHGGRLLVNESVRLTHRGRDAALVAVDDLVGGTPDLARARAGSHDAPGLLLSHCPGFRDGLGPEARGLVAMLSGHTHGGQITVGPWAPFRPRGSGDYTAGFYEGDPVDLYVSRGIGTSVVPVRLGSPPELLQVEWFPRSA